MSDSFNPWYVDNIAIQIISYLSADEIIKLSILSQYHLNLVRSHHWDELIVVKQTSQLINVLSYFNFRNIYLTYTNKVYPNNIDIDCFPNNLREKIKYVTFGFTYDINYLSLFKFFVENAKRIEVNPRPNKNTVFSDMPQIVYEGSILSIFARKIPLYLMCNDSMITILAKKYNDTFLISGDVSIDRTTIDIPNFRVKQLITKSCCSHFSKYHYMEIDTCMVFPDVIEKIYLFDQNKIREIEQKQLVIPVIQSTRYTWVPRIENNEIKWYIASKPLLIYSKSLQFLEPLHVWSNRYGNAYLHNACEYYGHDLAESEKQFYKLSADKFEKFFLWVSRSPLKYAFIFPFIFLNMYFAVKYYIPNQLETYIMCCVDYGLNNAEFNDIHLCVLHHILICVVNDGKIYIAINALDKMLNSEMIKKYGVARKVIITVALIHDNIVSRGNLNALLSIQSFFHNCSSPTVQVYRCLFSLGIPIASLFRTYDYVSSEMVTLIVDRIDATQTEEWMHDPDNIILINRFDEIINYYVACTQIEQIDMWMKLQKILCPSRCTKNNKDISKKIMFTWQNKKELLLHWKEKNLHVQIKKDLKSQCLIIAHHYNDFTVWSQYITIKPHNITPKILCDLFKKLENTDIKYYINLLNFWYVDKKKIDPTYHTVIDYISSSGLNKLLEWWKNKGLAFYYTREAFDRACQNDHIQTITWWILNSHNEKKFSRHSNKIYGGCYFKNGSWHGNMVILYSDAGLFMPNPTVYKIWKYHNFQIISKNKIKKEIRRRFKPHPEKRLELLDWLSGEKILKTALCCQ